MRVIKGDRAELEMKLTALLNKLDMTLDELDAATLDCGCCYSFLDWDRQFGVLTEIESLRFLLDV